MFKFTKNQTLILEVFFNHPEREYYLRELARILGKKPGVFQRDINILADDGILKSEHKGGNRYFKINKDNPLYDDLKSIFFKTVGIEGVLRTELQTVGGITKAFVYGSFARGEEKAESDVDIFIVGDVNEDKLIERISKLEGKFQRDINYILMSEKELHIKIEKGNSFLKGVLKEKKIELI